MRPLTLAFASLLLLAAPLGARADVFHFSFAANGRPTTDDFSFDLSDAPPVSSVDPANQFVVTTVLPIEAAGAPMLSEMHWYQGGFSFDSDDYTLWGATPFTGPMSALRFEAGSYQMSEFVADSGLDQGTLRISNVTTPEPGSLWLLATGMAAVGLPGLRRLRRA